MIFCLIDKNWKSIIKNCLQKDPSQLRIVCPFIKTKTIENILELAPSSLQVITRFNLNDFAKGVNDLDALRLILQKGGSIRGINGLHAKLFIFGNTSAIITSANLTNAGLMSNQEFGVLTEDKTAIRNCHKYFERLWNQAQPDLEAKSLYSWEIELKESLVKHGNIFEMGFMNDYGSKVGFELGTETHVPPIFSEQHKSFVKFLGSSNNRVSLETPIIEELKRSECHRVLAYPRKRRPRIVSKGSIMFIARLVNDPVDICIFGRAIAQKYEEGRDDATEEDIKRRDWRERWSRYIRVHNAEFVAGTMNDGISLNQLMAKLEFDAFHSTQQNKAKGKGNTDPRKAYSQQAGVRLTQEGFEWVNTKLQQAINKNGKVPHYELNRIE